MGVVASEHLLEYYKFLACLELTPFVYEKTDGDITGNGSKQYTITDKWYSKFRQIRSDLSVTEAKAVRTDVGNIVKRNTKANIIELNHKIMDMIRVDEEFKSSVLSAIITRMDDFKLI
jgi:hypothetical protein